MFSKRVVEKNAYAPAFVLAALAICALCAALVSVPARAFAETQDFALLADTHLGQPGESSYEDAEDALTWAGELGNLQAVCVAGDLTDRGAAVSYSEWEYLCESYIPGVPALVALGDHDTGKGGIYLGVDPSLTVGGGYARFLDIVGGKPTVMREFSRVNVITFGGISAPGYSTITNAALKELNARLKRTARAGKMAVVVCHYPYTSPSLSMRAKLMGVLRSYPNVIYVSGHRHRYTGAARCHAVTPACTTTKFSREGFNRLKKYSFISVGVNACSSYRSGGYSYADSLSVASSGSLRLKRWNLTKGKVERIWSIKRHVSSVAVKVSPASSLYPKSAKLRFTVTFSDGKSHGGVKSGSTITLKPGQTKKFRNLPAGVLVKVRLAKAPNRWLLSGAKSVEVGTSARALVVKPSYQKAGKHAAVKAQGSAPDAADGASSERQTIKLRAGR